ncbi:hypothetical protein HZC07_05640, partial [Candidatus Micrarchaeota archaeon]|nr:hypothetical protein [Candidatus Micrarchaeota archaeon]
MRFNRVSIVILAILLCSLSFSANFKVETVHNNQTALKSFQTTTNYIVTLKSDAPVQEYEKNLNGRFGKKLLRVNKHSNTFVISRSNGNSPLSKSDLSQQLSLSNIDPSDIEKIEEDTQVYPTLADSVPMVNASYAWDL